MITSLKVVIFDYGNVLTQSQGAQEIGEMAGLLRLPVDQFEQSYWKFRHDYDSALMDPSEYWATVARTAGRSISPPDVDELIDIDNRSWTHPNRITPGWARDLQQAGFRIAILSNMPVTLRDVVLHAGW